MGRRADRGVTVLTGVVLPERYEPIRRIARGGMATVWCAQDRTLDRHVAIKLLAEPFAHDELAGRRFKREARAAARLSGHSSVVTIYDVGQAMPSDEAPLGRPFIVMEYLAGGTVADALRLDRVEQATAITWLHQAAAALDFAHSRGVIHRDVKLANFLLDRERVLHVADFGIAQLGTEDTLSVSGQVVGTAGYLAPERALGQPATEASDRYALAVAAFELLVGGRPFTAEPFTAQARQHVEDPPPRASRRNPTLPRALDPVLARGMAKHPEERFTTARELADAIERALSRSAKRAAGAAAPTLIGRPAARSVDRRPAAALTVPAPRGANRGRMAAFAALAAALVGVAIVTGTSRNGSPVTSRPAAQARALARARSAQEQETRQAAVARQAAESRQAAAAQTATVQEQTSTTAATPTTHAPSTSTSSSTHTVPAGANALQVQGHQLMVGGNYQTAIAVLRQAVATAPSGSLTYAYALYDLGHALRLAGNPRAAVPVLWRRLQIPNQTDVVRSELGLALRALGQQQATAAPAPPKKPPKDQGGQRGPKGKGRHHPHDGAQRSDSGPPPTGQGD